MDSVQSGRITTLTGLRFVAALAVYLSHLPAAPGAPKSVQTFLYSGYSGVTLFFILSGFVLAWNYGDRLGDRMTGRGLWSYGVARFARIYPLYLFALGWAVAPAVVAGRDIPYLRDHVLSVQTWSGNVNNAYAHNGPGWSIGVELFLYACFPLLLFAVRPIRRNPKALVMLAGCGVAFGFAALAFVHLSGQASLPWPDPDSAHRWLYRNPAARLGDFVLGMAGALLLASSGGRALSGERASSDERASSGGRVRAAVCGRWAQLVGGGAIVLLMCSSTVFRTAASFDAGYMLPMFLLIVGLAAAPSTLLGRLLSTKPAILLGEASFALYLLHATLLPRLAVPWQDRFGSWLAAQAATLAIILCVAVGAHVLIEKPAQRWLRTVLDRRPARGTPGRIAGSIPPIARNGLASGSCQPVPHPPAGRAP